MVSANGSTSIKLDNIPSKFLKRVAKLEKILWVASKNLEEGVILAEAKRDFFKSVANERGHSLVVKP